MESSLHQSNTYHISSTITTTTPTVISILFDDMLCTICVTDSTILILTDLNGGRTTGSWRIVRAGAPQISPADGFSSDQYIHSYQVYIYWSILTHLVYFHRIYIHNYQHQVYFHIFKIHVCKFLEECMLLPVSKSQGQWYDRKSVNWIFSFPC